VRGKRGSPHQTRRTVGTAAVGNPDVPHEVLRLRKRLEQQQQRVGELEGEAAMLREKNKSINSCINEKINSINNNHKYFDINHKVYRDIKAYLQEKETVLKAQVITWLYSVIALLPLKLLYSLPSNRPFLAIPVGSAAIF
jgi:hypothetical protein